MKKILLSFLAGFLFLTPVGVDAKIDIGQDRVQKAANTAGYDKANETSLAELIGTVIKGVLSFVGVIFMVLTVYAGFLWMTAQGEETKIEKAQGIIKSSVVGLVVMLGAYSITSFVVPMILDKTAGGNGPDNGPSGEETILCCSVCPGQGMDCVNSIVENEEQCTAKADCERIGSDCSVIPGPASQCTGTIDIVNCCSFTNPDGVTTKEIMADEAGCDAKAQYYCDQIPGCRAGNNVDYTHDYQEGIPASQCR